MTESEISDLAHALALSTPLSRLNHAEAIAVVTKMTELAIVTALPVPAVTK